MIPVNQFILGSSDPLLYPSEKMTNSIDEQIAFLQSQKQAINEAYRRNAIPNANNGTTQNQQIITQGIWDAIDAEIAPLTQEQQNMLLSNQDYVNNYNALQSMVQAEVLNLVRGKIEASADGKHLLEEQLKLVKLLKSKIVEVTNKEMELFKAFKEASKTNHYCKTIKGNYLRIVPFFIYLNFSMDKFIDVIVDGILSNFDFGFMFIVNVLTYIIIKVIDYFNGDNKVPTWQKRCVLIISIFTMAMIYIASGYDNTIMLVNSAVLAPVFWSWVVSPILKKLGVGYKDIDNTIG